MCRFDVVHLVMVHLLRDSRVAPEIWKFGEDFSGVPIAIFFILGNRVDAVWAAVDRDVTLFKSLVAVLDQEAEIG